MKQKTKNKISLKAILIVALLLMAIILPSMSSMLPVNAATMYSVNLYDHDGTLLYSDSVEANSSSFKYPAYNGVGMPGYEFVGWKVGSQIKKAGVTVGNMISNITGTASFAEIEDTTYYTVTFNPNGGTRQGGGALSQSVISGGSATAPTVTRDGYTFSSWSGSYTNVTSDRTVTAQWTQNTTEYYTVTFYGDGGLSGSASSIDVSVPKGGKVSSSDIPTFIKSGYIFLGFASLGHTTIIDFSQYTISSSQSFLAQWAEGGVTYYTVTFDLNGGSRVSGSLSQSVASGGNATAPTTTRNGYTFTGWAGSYTNVTSDRTVTALWTENTTEYYTVTFYGDGGLCGQASSIKVNVVKGEKVKATDIPVFEKNGYDFLGFAVLGTTTIIDITQYTISNSQSFVAIWEANTIICTVYFNTGGADHIGGGAIEQKIPYGSKITNPPILAKVGFEFRGWHNGSSEIIDLDTFIVVDSTTVLTTDFGPLFYTVTFDPAGGTITSGNASQSIKHGSDAVPPIVTRNDYIFDGWTDYTNITSDRTVSAKWKPFTYTVTFAGNGGSWTQVGKLTVDVPKGEKVKASDMPVFERAGYTFLGFASAGHTEIIDFSQLEINSSLTYIAMWSLLNNYCEVKFAPAGGIYKSGGNYVQSVRKGESVTNPPVLERDGYIFNGWDKSLENITSSCTITALWKRDPLLYEVTIRNNLNDEVITLIIDENGCISFDTLKNIRANASDYYTLNNMDSKNGDLFHGDLSGKLYKSTINFNKFYSFICGKSRAVYSMNIFNFKTVPVMQTVLRIDTNLTFGFYYTKSSLSLDLVIQSIYFDTTDIKGPYEIMVTFTDIPEVVKEPTNWDKFVNWLKGLFPKKEFNFWPWEWSDSTVWYSYVAFGAAALAVLSLLFAIIFRRKK